VKLVALPNTAEQRKTEREARRLTLGERLQIEIRFIEQIKDREGYAIVIPELPFIDFMALVEKAARELTKPSEP
jgi:hypothetical protein